ncbi:MAG: hypothetical protein R2774_02025 [Saprospiraceae bacterium]
MRGILLIAYFILSYTLCSSQEFKIFRPLDADISFLAPCDMEYATKDVLTEIGKLKTASWSCVSNSDGRQFAYVVTYTEYPEGTLPIDSTDLLQTVLDESILQNVSDIKGDLVYKVSSPYQNYIGMLYRASFQENKAILKARFILIHDILYNLQVYAPTENSLSDDIDAFLNSFEYMGQ